jgi:phosphoglucomutase/phosphomannomutase
MINIDRIEKELEAVAIDRKAAGSAAENIDQWLTNALYKEYIPYIEHLVEGKKWKLLLDCFWRMIPFGTAGRRGAVGVGPNRINPITIGLSVQGHCRYLKELNRDQDELKVVIAYDVREFFDFRGHYRGINGPLKNLTSVELAKVAAEIYAGNGISCYTIGPLSDEGGAVRCRDNYISTPELSFLIREMKAGGGINISASHNHPDDNGGKFYNSGGGQEVPPNDEKLLTMVQQVKEIKSMPYKEARAEGLINFVPAGLHKKYIEINKELSLTESRSARIAYSPLCGTGMTTVYESLTGLGFSVELVKEQAAYDGSFKSIANKIANPEVPESLDKLLALAKKKNCDVGFATDPDADRLGFIAAKADGNFLFLNGNELGVILLQSIISSRKKRNMLPAKGIFINTLVTSGLQRKIAKTNGLQVVGDLMVGFKYMGNVMNALEKEGRFPADGRSYGKDSVTGSIKDFIFTCEEAYGYLLSPYVRDKDACGAAVHLAGFAGELKDQNKTFEEYLRDIYRVYGYFRNDVRSLVMEGIDGLMNIGKIQSVLRENPPSHIGGYPVISFLDQQKIGGPVKGSTDMANRNVLLFNLKGKGDEPIRVLVRPSGTEPKTKIYVEVPSESSMGGTLEDADFHKLSAISDDKLDGIIKDTNETARHIGNEFLKYCLGPGVLGSVFGEIAEELPLISDLVAVNKKVLICNRLMPDLLKAAKEDYLNRSWIDDNLKVMGVNSVNFIKDAVLLFLKNRMEQGDLSFEAYKKSLKNFNYL